jgi:AcrR family transcriptional regulator
MKPQVIDAATRLFAALGYDATSMEQIAEAAGVEIADLRRECGKQDLYLTVVERGFQAESASLQEILRRFRCETAADCVRSIHLLVDGYVDFAAGHPEVHALWVHRWLEDAIGVADLESRFLHPLFTTAVSALTPARERGFIGRDVDLEFALHTMMWIVHGFGQGGVPQPDGEWLGFSDPEIAQRFRHHLHQVMHRTLRLPGDYS